MFMISGIHTIIVQTTNMERSVQFYKETLGLTLGYGSPFWTDFQLGSLRIGIHPAFRPDDSPAVLPFKNAVIGVETPDVVALRRAIETSNGKIHGDFHDTPSGVVLDFTDPDGNNWQAIQVGIAASQLKTF